MTQLKAKIHANLFSSQFTDHFIAMIQLQNYLYKEKIPSHECNSYQFRLTKEPEISYIVSPLIRKNTLEGYNFLIQINKGLTGINSYSFITM